MVSESLARRFKPAGFDQPEGSRHQYTKPRPELQEAFNKWVNGLPEKFPCWEEPEKQYRKAVNAIEEFGKIQYKEANSLLVDFKPKTEGQEEAGLFVSACYTYSPEHVIVFDVDAPEINYIGYRTKKNIFNNGKVGDDFAQYSSGLAVNNSDCGDRFAQSSSGSAVNNGKCKVGFASYSSGFAINNGDCGGCFANNSSGLAVNNGDCGVLFASWSSGLAIAVSEPKSYEYKKEGVAIKPEDFGRIPDLKNYLDELSEITKNLKGEQSAKKFLERYGSEPKEKIEVEIKEILRRWGFI